MRISDWSSDVCSSDLPDGPRRTGDADLDRIIEAIEERDIETLAPLVELPTVQCTNAQGLGGPPTCEEGMPEGNELQVFPFSSCEGEWTRRSEERRVGKECVSTCRYRGSRGP